MSKPHDLSKAVSYASSYGQTAQALQGSVWTRRQGKRFLFEVGLVCQLIAVITLLISFCSPFWIISWPRVYSSFKRIGLWEACFAGLILDTDPSAKSYHGCWWVLAPEFYEIRGWLLPGWFIFVQVAVTVCLVAEVISFAFNLIIWISTGGVQKDGRYKERESMCMLTTSTWITIITALLMSASVMTFAIAFKLDRMWLPNGYFNYLSWSYGLAVVSTFFSFFALIAHMTYLMIVRKQMLRPPPTVSMSGGVPRAMDSTL